MTWKSLPIDIEQSTEHPDRLKVSCRFCEMVWIGAASIPDAAIHIDVFHPDKSWCGHKFYANGHCAVLSCPNYYAKHWEIIT